MRTWRIVAVAALASSCSSGASPAAPASATPASSASPSSSPSSASSAEPAAPTGPLPTGTERCTPGFTPHQPGAEGCSAHHTVCRTAASGEEECHGGAIRIACGETGERCGQQFHCDCSNDPAAASSTKR